MTSEKKGIGKGELVALIVSSSIGTGAFGIMSDLAGAAAPGPMLLAWVFVGIGIFALVMSLNNLGAKRPELSAGIFSYPGEQFGPLGEFISGWAYWLSAWLGNIAFATMLMSSFGTFFPAFKGGQNLASILVAIVFVWLLTILVNNGIEGASFINTIVTICKLIPIFVFMVFMIISFKAGVFTADFWGNVADNTLHNGGHASVFTQMKGSVMVMMWVFVGIEGASVLGNRAKKKSDARAATTIALIALLAIYVLISLLPFGVFSQAKLAAMDQPAMGEILKAVVGPWGSVLINVGLIISTLGSWLSWTMLPAETTMLMARDKTLQSYWGKLNKKGAPTASLVITGVLQTVFLFSLLFTEYAYNFAYSLSTAAILISWLLVGTYQVQYSYQKKDWTQFAIGIVAAAFQLIAMVLAGWQQILMVSILCVPGFIFYYLACRENDRKMTRNEKLVIAAFVIVAIISVVLICTGVVSIG
ncbi:basic amino acid/polyamine antiporter [Bifidobacterium sp. ESL0763]|uniref:basic amino acid/polyamine antiporter n=1 Tax=Bifidobacterium sp. ESL0763 TaxID=2983227 RepID=UPI0023F86451|nr:basic amino acid/polyamine antiporter [Bifidobacterium sp. ESL0763]MDF7663723.1 basic amino acid/polyamine antiporter [Bifidobacterium sp. ESL0763]